MPTTLSATTPSITFPVDTVTPATTPLPECRAHQAVKQMLDSPIESCSDYHGTVIRDINYQPLLAAVYTAFSQHRPLIVTPDSVWLTIAQGVAQHMAIHAERLRSRFVSHHGRLDLVFTCTDWIEGSPENPWPEAFESWTTQIRDHVGPHLHDLLGCDFSTSGPLERAVGQIVMMDIFERYFHYIAYCICGIPTVTLEGSAADWEHLEEKVRRLTPFDMDWWLEHLLPICHQFVRASRGDIDLPHWQAICKLREEYGGDIINGWIAKLFPYIRPFIDGPCNQRNPIFETGEGFQTLHAPSGLSQVPFEWRNAVTKRTHQMEAIGGLVGVTQDQDTLALRPKIGWAIRPAPPLDVLFRRVESPHVTFPGTQIESRTYLPADLAQFYHRTNGADLFPSPQGPACRILPADKMEPIDSGEKPSPFSRGPDGRIWHRFALLANLSWLAINLDMNRRSSCPDDPSLQTKLRDLRENYAPIYLGKPQRFLHRDKHPVIALSFGEFLQRLLDANGKPYWDDPAFKCYGIAKQFS